MGMILEVYSGDSPRKKIAVVPFRLNPQFLEELGEGGGSFSVRSGDERLEYLQVRNYVKVKVESKVIAGFVITGLEPKLVDSGEFAGRNTVVKGKGFLSSASDAVVLPHGGLKPTSPDTRSFNFASPRGSWINLGTWRQPHVIAKRGAKGNPWGTAPAEWPDFPTANWIWGQPYKHIPNEGAPGSPQPPRGPISPDNSGFCYFRRDFTTSAKGKYSFFVAADDIYEVYVNGQLLATAKPGHENWTKTQRVDFELEAGPQVIGVKVHNTSGSGGFIGALAEVGESDQKKKAKLLAVTGATTWRVLPFPASNPGWTPGEIMNQLISEARTRGVRWAKNLKLGYTSTKDSNGELWNRDVDYTFSIGENYLSVINKLTEASCDVWIDPADFTLHMAKSRGKDRTDPKLGNGVVQLLLGKNLLSATQTVESDIKNTLVVESSTGRLTVKDSKSIAKYGVIEDSLNLSTDSGVARTIASKVLSARSNKTVGATYKVIPFPGAVPTKDFEVGDWILAPGEDGAKTRRRVTSISVTEDKDTGAVLYDVEFDTIFLTRQQHIDRWVTNTQNGSMGGTVLTSNYRPPSISTASSSTSMAGSIQNNVVVAGGSMDTEGYFTAAGAPAASVSFSWDVESEYESDSADHSYVYEVYGVPDTSSPNSVVLHTTTTDTQVTVRDLPVGEDYTLRLVAKNEAGEEVSVTDFEVALPMPDAVGMAAPSKPTVYTSQGTVVVEWDGHMAEGAVKPSQLTHVRAVASPVPGGPYTERGPLISKEGGAATFVGLPRGEERYVALVSVDTVGNESVASEEASLAVRGIEGDRDIESGTINKDLLDNGILSELGDLESATKDRSMLIKNHSFETDGSWEPVKVGSFPENVGRVEVGEEFAYDGKWVVRASTDEDTAVVDETSTLSLAAASAPVALNEGGTYAASVKVKFSGVFGEPPATSSALVQLLLVEVVSHEPYADIAHATGSLTGNTAQPDEWLELTTGSVKLPAPITGEYRVKYAAQAFAVNPPSGVVTTLLDSVEVYDRTPVMAVNGNTFSQNPPAGVGAGVGSLWYQYAVEGGVPGDIIGMWRWDGTAWESMGLNNQVIANLDAGKIDTGFLNAARILASSITAEKLAVDALDFKTATGMELSASKLSSSEIYGTYIEGGKFVLPNTGELTSSFFDGCNAVGPWRTSSTNNTPLVLETAIKHEGTASLQVGTLGLALRSAYRPMSPSVNLSLGGELTVWLYTVDAKEVALSVWSNNGQYTTYSSLEAATWTKVSVSLPTAALVTGIQVYCDYVSSTSHLYIDSVEIQAYTSFASSVTIGRDTGQASVTTETAGMESSISSGSLGVRDLQRNSSIHIGRNITATNYPMEVTLNDYPPIAQDGYARTSLTNGNGTGRLEIDSSSGSLRVSAPSPDNTFAYVGSSNELRLYSGDKVTVNGTEVSVSGHTHPASAITSGVLGAARIPYATQAEVNAGTLTTDTVTPATLRNSANLPYSTSAGGVSVSATGSGTAITFPSGRFSVAPRLTLTVYSTTGGVVGVAWHSTVTASGVTGVRVFSLAGAQVGGSVSWTAIQMTSSSASG